MKITIYVPPAGSRWYARRLIRVGGELIDLGPPAGSRITAANWQDWHARGFISCPGSRTGPACRDWDCKIASACKRMRAIGLTGDGRKLPSKLRPACGARNRRGEPCRLKLIPGKRRCRFHGGLSTGPASPEGRARIAQAQRQRWARWRATRDGGDHAQDQSKASCKNN
jgi:hypothetical protein